MGAGTSETAHGEVHGIRLSGRELLLWGGQHLLRPQATLPDGCPQPPHSLRGLCRKTNAETTCLFSHPATRFLQTMVPVVPGQPGWLERPRAESQRLGRSGQGPGWHFSPRTAPLGAWGSWFMGQPARDPESPVCKSSDSCRGALARAKCSHPLVPLQKFHPSSFDVKKPSRAGCASHAGLLLRLSEIQGSVPALPGVSVR